MNERFLFRGKDSYTGEWFLGYFAHENNDLGEITRWQPNDSGCLDCEVFVLKNTVGQSTGLHDKNGVLIFEGDIVRFGNEPDWVGEVVWSDEVVGFTQKRKNKQILLRQSHMSLQFCILGNIHDNPELLKGDDTE